MGAEAGDVLITCCSITSYTSVLYDCNRLVGGTGNVPSSTVGKNNLVLGSMGVLTDPGSDSHLQTE